MYTIGSSGFFFGFQVHCRACGDAYCSEHCKYEDFVPYVVKTLPLSPACHGCCMTAGTKTGPVTIATSATKCSVRTKFEWKAIIVVRGYAWSLCARRACAIIFSVAHNGHCGNGAMYLLQHIQVVWLLLLGEDVCRVPRADTAGCLRVC
jgi:hypothetical protein